MTTTLTISLIVRNEEHSLGRCLDSVQGLADEIVVVDTGSTDGTREVAAGRGARVFDFPWCDDFAAARNETLRHATGRWVLWLDADEYFDEANRWRGLQLSPVEIGAQTTCRFPLTHVFQPMQNGFHVGDSALLQE